MTTDTEIRDLLSGEAAGPVGPAQGWDDVVRRGRRRQRVRRAQGATLALVAAGVTAAAIALAADDPTVDTVPPATSPTAPDPTAPEPSLPDPADPTTSTTSFDAVGTRIGPVSSARFQGVFLTVIIPPADPTSGFDPCTDLHPRVVESSEQIGIELVTEELDRGLPWAACLSSPFSGAGTIELLDPVGDRPVLDLTTGNAIRVTPSGSLLFPTTLPEPFQIDVYDELAFDGSWTFSFSMQDLVLNVATDYAGSACEGSSPVEVRGVEGQLCEGDLGYFVLSWTEPDGSLINIELVASDPEQPTGFTRDDVLAIAEGLQYLDV